MHTRRSRRSRAELPTASASHALSSPCCFGQGLPSRKRLNNGNPSRSRRGTSQPTRTVEETCHGFVTRTPHSFTLGSAPRWMHTRRSRRSRAELPTASASARLEFAMLLRSGSPVPQETQQWEPVSLKTWNFPTNTDGGRDGRSAGTSPTEKHHSARTWVSKLNRFWSKTSTSVIFQEPPIADTLNRAAYWFVREWMCPQCSTVPFTVQSHS